MKTPEQLAESIDRYRTAFWNRESGVRPPVGISSDDANTPIKFLHSPFTGNVLGPDEVNGDLYMSDYNYMARDRSVVSDDLMPFSSPWRAVPWLEAMCGCPVRYSYGSLAPGHNIGTPDALALADIPSDDRWVKCHEREIKRLAASEPSDCWISPSILRGPSDILAAMRGMTEFYCDLHDCIDIIDEAAGRINNLLIDSLETHFRHVKPNMDGYVQTYGHWAPGPTYVIQEDAMGMCSPATYREVFRKYNCRVVERLGAHIFFHVHSTGYGFYRDVLSIPGLAGIEMTVEENGPRLIDMVDDLKDMLERSRLILFVYHFFEDLPEVLRQIPHDGLYLVISDKFIRSEKEFRDFVRDNWE